MTIMSDIRMKWMQDNIPNDRCEQLTTLTKKYSDYLDSIKDRKELKGFVGPLSIKKPVLVEIKYARDKLATMAHYNNDKFQVRKIDNRVCIIQVKEQNK